MDKYSEEYPYHGILLSNEKDEYGWISKYLCWVKEARPKKRVYIEWCHLCKTLENAD